MAISAVEFQKEKRTILKEYLSQSAVNCQSIILEENFVFSKQRRNYLAYDNIFLKNLSEVEKLASLYADKIIIIRNYFNSRGNRNACGRDSIIAQNLHSCSR